MSFTTGKKLKLRTAAVQAARERDEREARKLKAWKRKFFRTWGREPSEKEIRHDRK